MSLCNKPRVLVSHGEIDATLGRLAATISLDYRDNNPLLIGVLKGSIVFLADLARRLDFPLEFDFVRLSSYARGTETSGTVRFVNRLVSPVRNRHVLVVEDIVDTGLTVAFLMDYFRKKKPASLKLCALLDKPSRRRVPLTIDYLGITVPDHFLVGYGLDFAEKYRNLPDICVLEEGHD
jgi:hypoxanthine phosphoribosyltransferase